MFCIIFFRRFIVLLTLFDIYTQLFFISKKEQKKKTFLMSKWEKILYMKWMRVRWLINIFSVYFMMQTIFFASSHLILFQIKIILLLGEKILSHDVIILFVCWLESCRSIKVTIFVLFSVITLDYELFFFRKKKQKIVHKFLMSFFFVISGECFLSY